MGIYNELVAFNCSHVLLFTMLVFNPFILELILEFLKYQSLRYAQSCLSLTTLIKMSTNNPSQKSVVLESSVNPSHACQFGMLGYAWLGFWQKNQEPLTYWLGVVGIHFNQGGKTKTAMSISKRFFQKVKI